MHIALARIIAKNSVDHDLLFALVEPTFFPPQRVPAFLYSCLCRRGWQVEPGNNTDKTCNTAFDREKPTPSLYRSALLSVFFATHLLTLPDRGDLEAATVRMQEKPR